ncbi:MAG: hypothetical protein RLZZ488_2346 [Pseudomonadota bacterium]
MSLLISDIAITQELGLIAAVASAVGLYLAIALQTSKRRRNSNHAAAHALRDSQQSELAWDDRQALFWRHSLGTLSSTSDLFFISAFSAELLQKRTQNALVTQRESKICVSRSAQDSEKLIHPLIKKIESRLRRAELRPRPRLRIFRQTMPFPLFSSTRPDIELSTYVLNFLDACIDLSMSCDTQVNFNFKTDNDGICIAAEWKKNQLIADATAQIELLDNMRLTMSGDMVKWEYQIFDSGSALNTEAPLDEAISA